METWVIKHAIVIRHRQSRHRTFFDLVPLLGFLTMLSHFDHCYLASDAYLRSHPSGLERAHYQLPLTLHRLYVCKYV